VVPSAITTAIPSARNPVDRVALERADLFGRRDAGDDDIPLGIQPAGSRDQFEIGVGDRVDRPDADPQTLEHFRPLGQRRLGIEMPFFGDLLADQDPESGPVIGHRDADEVLPARRRARQGHAG
jgi:hypothetical protein